MIKMKDLMVQIRNRPEIYIGEKSFTRLIAFIRGYEYCQRKYILESSVLTGFDEYVHGKYNLSNNIPSDFEKDILLFSAFNESIAFDNFFRLYESYNLKKNFQPKILSQTLIHVLEKIKLSPEKFIKSKSFNKLMSFIYGFEICEYNFDKNYQRFKWNKLFKYLANKYHINDNLTLNVEQIIRYISENDLQAFDLFFEEYERYLSLEK